MCGISGLHLRNPSLYPRLRELLGGMLCEAAERGTDAAGIGLYGDDRLTPPGTTTVSVLDATLPVDDLIRGIEAYGPTGVQVIEAGQTTLITANGSADELEAS